MEAKLRKSDLQGPSSHISDKQIAERQPVNLFEALQGQAAGVLAMNDSGEPGAQGSLEVRALPLFPHQAMGCYTLYMVLFQITQNIN